MPEIHFCHKIIIEKEDDGGFCLINKTLQEVVFRGPLLDCYQENEQYRYGFRPEFELNYEIEC